MSDNGSGVAQINSTGQPVVSATTIASATFNAFTADVATMLSNRICKDGQTTVTADIPLNAHKITGLAAATARTDAASLATIQDGTGVHVSTVGGTADVITLTPTPAIASYATGQTFRFLASGTNTTAVTINVSGLGAKAITKNGTTALIAGDLNAGELIIMTYDGTRFVLNACTNRLITATGSTAARLLSDRFADVTNALDFGAIGLQATIQAALTWLGTQTTITQGAALYIPRGDWAITTGLTIPSTLTHLKLYGEGKYATRLNLSLGVTGLLASSAFTNCSITDIGWVGGAKALSLFTNNTDESMLSFERCLFGTQTTGGVELITGSNSTQLTLTECIFNGAGYAVSSYADYTYIRRCWVETSTPNGVFINHSGTMILEDNLCASMAGYSESTSCWVSNDGHLYARRNRFGADGDSIGRPIVWQRSTFSSCTVEVLDNYAPSANYNYKFDAAPEVLRLSGNTGYGGLSTAKGMWFNASAVTGKANMERGKWQLDDLEFPNTGYFANTGTNNAPMCELAYAKFTQYKAQELSSQILFADALLSYDSSIRPGETSKSNITVGIGAYPLLGGFTAKKLTCTLEHGRWQGFNELITGPTNSGVQTAVVDCYITGATRPFWFEAQYQGTYYRQIVYNGLNVMCFRYQPDSAFVNQYVIWDDIPNGTVILIGRMRTFIGAKQITTAETIYSDLSTGTIPNTVNIYHMVGDRTVWANATSGAYTGQVCTTYGQPGIWKSYGAIL